MLLVLRSPRLLPAGMAPRASSLPARRPLAACTLLASSSSVKSPSCRGRPSRRTGAPRVEVTRASRARTRKTGGREGERAPRRDPRDGEGKAGREGGGGYVEGPIRRWRGGRGKEGGDDVLRSQNGWEAGAADRCGTRAASQLLLLACERGRREGDRGVSGCTQRRRCGGEGGRGTHTLAGPGSTSPAPAAGARRRRRPRPCRTHRRPRRTRRPTRRRCRRTRAPCRCSSRRREG